MDTRMRDKDVMLPPDEIRRIAKAAYDNARNFLATKRKEKIFLSLRKAKQRHEPASVTAELRRGAMLSMQSISTVTPCSTTMERVDRAPNGLAWVRVSTNLKTPENCKDKFFVPYLGESDEQQNFSNSVAADDDLCLAEQYAEDDISDVDNTVKVTPVEGPGISPGKQLHAMKKRSQKNAEFRSSSRYGNARGCKSSEVIWDRSAKRIALEEIMKKLCLKDIRSVVGIIREAFGTQSKDEIESSYKNVVYRRRAYKESDDEALLRHDQKEDLLTQLKGTVRTQPGEALKGDSIPFFFCRQCYIYNCLEHGTQTAKPAKPPPDRSKKDTVTRQAADDLESRCPDRDVCQCWCISHSKEDAAKWWQETQTNQVLKDNVKSIVLELFASFGMDPCRISELGRLFLLDHGDSLLTCHRVGYLLATLEESNLKDSQTRPSTKRSRKKYRTKAPRGETESMKGGQRVDYAPCQHDGPCTAKTCRCVENGVNCEKYCSCNHNRMHSSRPDKRLACNHAFQGCTCRSAVACISNACVCYSYGRECDPDLCRACFDCRDSNRRRSCRNVGLLMGERQRTVVGRSETHGWGAFATADIAKGEIIGEYVGEVVSHVDADRRGRLYDKIDYSFLFNITEDWALDSTRLGNKLRYCNHHFKPNCAAKLMRVGGDVRVGLYAVRDIGKHEELFFDYKYKNGPAWSMPGSDGQGSSSRRKQDGSAKKRASAVENEEEEEEVIPVPKKRARPERRHSGALGEISHSVRYANGVDADEESLVAERRGILRAKGPNGTHDSIQGNRTVKRDVVDACDEDLKLPSKARIQNVPDSKHCPTLGNGMPHESKLPKERARKPFVHELHASRVQGQLKDVPPDSRARNVVSVNNFDDSDSDLQTKHRRLQNGSNWQGQDRSAVEQRVGNPSALLDVFGSDLESQDDKANLSALDPGSDAQAIPTASGKVISGKSKTSPFPSGPVPRNESDRLTESKGAQIVTSGPAISTVVRITKGHTPAPGGITKIRSHRRDKIGKSSHDWSIGKLPAPKIATPVSNVSGLTKPVGRAEMHNLNSISLRAGSALHKDGPRDRGTGAGAMSTLNHSRTLRVSSGNRPSVIPHINLISDGEDKSSSGSPERTRSESNSWNDGSEVRRS